ncbi:hypothetical protein LCGC14_2072190, partial [marine sediment metagenome]
MTYELRVCRAGHEIAFDEDETYIRECYHNGCGLEVTKGSSLCAFHECMPDADPSRWYHVMTLTDGKRDGWGTSRSSHYTEDHEQWGRVFSRSERRERLGRLLLVDKMTTHEAARIVGVTELAARYLLAAIAPDELDKRHLQNPTKPSTFFAKRGNGAMLGRGGK